MMPLVTVPPRVPRGLPTATTSSPTARLSLSPMTAGVRPVASIFSTAMSATLSEPTTVAVYCWSLSYSWTLTLDAPSMTWAQVKI